MSKYTTGELAKLCQVSVRTVQYYDTRGILVPSTLSEGGRRLYSQQDLDKLKIICFLRELELPIDSIRELLTEENPEQVLELLFQEQEMRLRREIDEKQKKAEKIAQARKTLGLLSRVSVESIGDVAHIMEHKKKLRRMRIRLTAVGLLMDAIQTAALMLWIFRGDWISFAVGMTAVIALGCWVTLWYFRRTAYLCPQCHTVFKPDFWECLWARHTPNTRRLTCPQCSRFGYCVETYGKEEPPC